MESLANGNGQVEVEKEASFNRWQRQRQIDIRFYMILVFFFSKASPWVLCGRFEADRGADFWE